LYQPAADSDLIKRAYDFSSKAHTGQMRKSGDPYFIHPASVAGIITERDYARKVVLKDRSSKTTPVRDIMSKAVRFVRPDQSSDECMALMTDRRIRHLPVIDQERLIGMISIGDLVKNIIAEQQFTIQQLEHYIAGERT